MRVRCRTGSGFQIGQLSELSQNFVGVERIVVYGKAPYRTSCFICGSKHFTLSDYCSKSGLLIFLPC